ncbi:MAG: translation initiation factor eIF-1A [Marine Group II euryarchaeote MED-G36]|nr:MAG: translation initiation factor eIF-1A [Marine Group II euryarchaeote MED-G36]
MARREERVDTELLARLESGSGDRIRVPLPNKKINEMFAIADQILGGRRVRAVCADGESRLARIPGKMRRRQWVREGDLIILQPWDFQDAKADVRMRYTKTQSIYLSRKGVLPEIVDLFGMSDDQLSDDDEERYEQEVVTQPEPVEEEGADDLNEEVEAAESEPAPSSSWADDDDDDIDSFFG